MITQLSQLDKNKQYSYADYLTWKIKERVEIIKGHIFKMSPAPGMHHQKVSGQLYGLIWQFLKNNPCKVFSAPFDVRFPREDEGMDGKIFDVVQPDICVVCDPAMLDRRGCLGAPDLIIEILSPSTSQKDAKDKFQLYESQGVREYWMVHPEEQTLLVHLLDVEGNYQPSRLLVKGDHVQVAVLPGLTLDLDLVFEERDDY